MNFQAEEWDDMSEQTQREIKARLMAACTTQTDRNELRRSLANASRPAARLAFLRAIG